MNYITQKLIITFSFAFATFGVINATTQNASLRINKDVTFQKVTGYGGFVNSPQFGYGHMSETEIRKVWGKGSNLGLNIMRIYIPIGESNWGQCLSTAKLAKSLGLILFASPWSMPAEWKTYNTINAVYTDVNGVQQTTSLKEEYYSNYANYLNNFVSYLRNNGVELDAISIQNEPDEKASYAGCIWSPAQIANFLKNHRSQINCKVIAPESVGMSDNYVNALLASDVHPKFDIYGGHQYGYVQSGFKQLQALGKEAWMTEFLINWNSNSAVTPRNFLWSTDAFTFFNAVNNAMLANTNAWIHYASKRYYAMLGDGQYGSVTGETTKRGYILTQFAKFTTGSTRIESTWNDASNKLVGSSYLTVSGDSVVALISNPSSDSYNLTVDLPFYTYGGNKISTTETINYSTEPLVFGDETCRPKVIINPSSVTTIVFKKSSVRVASQMQGSRYNKIESLVVTNSAFGTSYQLSDKVATFDVNHPLISSNKTEANGYLKMEKLYNQLVMRVNRLTSAGSFTSANTTLYYINDAGNLSSKNYGNLTLPQSGSFDWIFDLSKTALTDGCKGIIGITNGNYTSVLTLTLGDVYLRMANEGLYKFSGTYSKGDSYFLDCLENSLTNLLDFSSTTSVDTSQDWRTSAANKNSIYFVNSAVANTNANVVSGTNCSQLMLADSDGNFYTPTDFNAINAGYTKTINGNDILVLPFEATIPSGVEVFTLQYLGNSVNCTPIHGNVIPANTAVLVKGVGAFTFTGSGKVSTPHGQKQNDLSLVYLAQQAPSGSYVLQTVNGVTAFHLVSNANGPVVPSCSAYFSVVTNQSSTTILNLNGLSAVNQMFTDLKIKDDRVFDLLGRQVNRLKKNTMYIKSGKVFMSNIDVDLSTIQ
ncbi:MAG TPA: hypothetical protein P5084_06910 [Paludibacter sp.]|nr:hypothetical protein [Paludibacter sp.]